MKTRRVLVTVFCLFALSIASQGKPVPTAATFFAPYTNPEQEKVPKDGIYPCGQRMWFSGYSNNKSQLARMHKAGFTMSGPHYHGISDYDYHPDMREADRYGMKTAFRLYVSGSWRSILPRMKSRKGREDLRNRILKGINSVLDDRRRNRAVAVWYGHEEEPITRDYSPIDEQRDYLEFVHEIIMETDPKKRPYYVSERSDSGQNNMIANQRYQDGVIKQNYFIAGNGYGDDDEMRVLMWQWARDQIIAAEVNDKKYPSYTGHKRAAITTLAMYNDPRDESKRNKTWLRKIITHDIYIQLAAGIQGFALYTWSGGSRECRTRKWQEDIYMDVLGMIAKKGLGEVFLWGDDRKDIKLKRVSGPRTVKWTKYTTTYKAPSIRMRNIQYGDDRYVLLVNSARKPVRLHLSGFPAGITFLDMIPRVSRDLNRTVTPPIVLQPLGVRMYKISMAD